ncbi:hypothetical protein [Microbacterium sp. TNHR37B]|uniref:hypothetical protein n=1 Tax=Microbacterium sp. TNHR37B TaxID=1775956 RepID=UPI0007B3053E|nr:hypothetical protein [Microbacterium sp. TNHR37B]KZE88452.1 hypothetical protein AVP41_02956 [Microbacterium sp. TNHR37B]
MRRGIRNTIAAVVLSAVALGGVAVPASAVSSSSSAKLPGTGAVIQANVWLCNTWLTSCGFQTSAKALKSGKAYKVSKIRNTADFNAWGIGTVTVGAVTVAGTSGSARNLVWTNYKTWISDHSGSASATWSIVALGLCSGAYAEVSGVRASSSACVGV